MVMSTLTKMKVATCTDLLMVYDTQLVMGVTDARGRSVPKPTSTRRKLQVIVDIIRNGLSQMASVTVATSVRPHSVLAFDSTMATKEEEPNENFIYYESNLSFMCH